MVCVFYFVFRCRIFLFMANIFVMYIVHNISEFLSPLQSWICMRFGGPILICATPRKIAYTKFPILMKWLRGIAHVHWTIFAKTLREVSSLKKVSISYAVLDMWRRHMILRRVTTWNWTRSLDYFCENITWSILSSYPAFGTVHPCTHYATISFGSTLLQVYKNVIFFRSPKKQNYKYERILFSSGRRKNKITRYYRGCELHWLS